MGTKYHIIGKKFNRLKVLKFSHRRKKIAYFECICDCGNTVTTRGSSLVNGHTKSCGCFSKDAKSRRFKKHGYSNTKEYKAWNAIIKRCTDSQNRAYENYGGRGIKVCKRWCDSFENFLEDMGKAPTPKHTIDRIDNDGDYTPDNCRWATMKQQMNNKRSNVNITWNGETKTATQWARKMNMPRSTFFNRLNNGWSLEKIFNTPIKHKKPNQ